MPPKIKLNKILNSLYEKAASIIDNQQPAVKNEFIDQELKWKADIKDRLQDITANDPYFIPQTPVVRIGHHGKEIVYGTRKANPWQLAMGEDMSNRIADLGYDIDAPYPFMFNGERIIFKPKTYINTQVRKPIDIVDMLDADKIIGGYRTYDGNTVYRLRPNSVGQNISNTQLHESLMHGTDDLIEGLGQSPLTHNSIVDEYSKVTSRIMPDSYGSHKWKELRATLGELKTSLYKQLASKKGRDFFKKAEITPELREEFNQMIDNMDANKLASLLEKVNGYGQVYAKLLKDENVYNNFEILADDPIYYFDLLTEGFSTDQIKKLLKYYPAVCLGTSAIYNPEPDNYVEERKYKEGGQIQNINKFTIYKCGGNIKKRCRKKSNC